MAKLFNQAIFRGIVDYYCLVCEIHFTNDAFLNKHVSTPTHKNNIKAAGYVEKYQDSLIRKIKNGYFCEYCNELMVTTANVTLHVENQQHASKRGALLLKCVEGNIFAFGNIYIDNKAWNGIVEETCIVCNIEFNDVEIHQSEAKHRLNLVQRITEFGTWGVIYRKIDKNSFHCLVCNKALLMAVFKTHFDSVKHKQRCSKSCPSPIPAPAMEPVHSKSTRKLPVDLKLNPVPVLKKQQLRSLNTVMDSPTKCTKPSVTYAYENIVCKLLNLNSYIGKNEKNEVYCVLCIKVLKSTPAIHLEGLGHQHILKAHNKRLEKKQTSSRLDALSEISESEDRYRESNIYINYTRQTVECKLCYKKLSFYPHVIDEHIDHHKERKLNAQLALENDRQAKDAATKLAIEYAREAAAKSNAAQVVRTADSVRVPPKTAPTQRAQTWSKFTSMTESEKLQWAAVHHIVFTHNQNLAHCSICNSTLPISLKNFSQHVGGNTHKSNLAKKHSKEEAMAKAKARPVRVLFSDYKYSMYIAESLTYQFYVVNNKFVIGYKSMCFMKNMFEGYLRCFLCCEDIEDTSKALESHRANSKHVVRQRDAPVIASLETEFVRQLDSGELHCGFCNCCTKNWNDLQNHFNTVEHRECKIAAEWRLVELNMA